MLRYHLDHALVMMVSMITRLPKNANNVTIHALLALRLQCALVVPHRHKELIVVQLQIVFVMSDIMMMDLVQHVNHVIPRVTLVQIL